MSTDRYVSPLSERYMQITLISRMVGAMTGFLPFYVLIT